MSIGKDLVAASATPLVLAILSEGESYGYAIIKRVEELSDGEREDRLVVDLTLHPSGGNPERLDSAFRSLQDDHRIGADEKEFPGRRYGCRYRRIDCGLSC